MTRGRLLAAALVATTALAGCTTMGGNIKGSFSCAAPDGICAPSSTIDDRALAMISGEDGDRMITPAGPYPAQRTDGRGFQTAAAAPARTHERVLRIVFPAQIDAAGRLHEQTAVHAVVEQGDWQQALGPSAVATPPAQVAAATGGDTLLSAVERADPPVSDVAAVDPDMPSEAAVAAARAKAASADPVGDIKDQVARRLSARPRRQAASLSTPARLGKQAPARPVAASAPSAPTATTAVVPQITASPTVPSASSARPAVRSTSAAPTGPATIVPRYATPRAKAVIDAVAHDRALRDRIASAKPQAREAARSATPTPVLPTVPVLRASSFPGVDQ
ncbi:conjugal transfer protein [Sphingomonas solaris]|uniref:Conjugal transfer protein n=1 Tax=Alterirhizorhabdus solaris TaxID=2529389 RepID=A0A558RC30_9SPHN|nr:conjugal transfer protein [Sphingomonas solaris]TVV76936.1 conjugal transfer protein [Sphingomonas solaris]